VLTVLNAQNVTRVSTVC